MKIIKRCGKIFSTSKSNVIKKIGRTLEAIDHWLDLMSRITCVEADMSLLQRQLTSIQAIDSEWHGEGKIIVLAHVGSKDYVEILPIRKKMNQREYMEMVKRLELEYGAKPEFVDAVYPSRSWKSDYERF